MLAAGWAALLVVLLLLAIECHRPIAEAHVGIRGRAHAVAPRLGAGPWAGRLGGSASDGEAGARAKVSSGEACAVGGVVLGEDGAPVAGVELSLVPTGIGRERSGGGDDEDPDGELTTHSDQAGAFSFAMAPGDYSLTGYLQHGSDERVTEVIDPISLGPGERADGLELHLGGGATISGRVLSVAGEAKANVEVCARVHPRDGACASRAATDDRGAFELTGAPRHRLYVVAVEEGREAMAEVSAPAREVELRLPEQPVVRGVVLDEAGAPMAGVEVVITDGDGRALGSTDSEEDGRFALAVDQRGPIAARASDDDRGVSEVVRRERGDARELRLVLRAGAAVAGRVIVAGTGAPYTDGTVVLLEGETALGTAALDEQGGYRFDHVPAGRFRVRLSDGHAESPASIEVAVDGQGEARAADLRVPAGRLLRGRVIDGAGHPVPGAEIDLVSAGGGFQLSDAERTDEQGRYTLGRYSGEVTLRAFAEGMVGERMVVAEVPGSDEQEVELRVSAERRVGGVVRGPNGAPRGGVRVGCDGKERTTGPAGRFELACSERATSLRLDDGGAIRSVPVALRAEGEIYLDVRL